MQVVRIYTGDDGESHFEDMDLNFEQQGNYVVALMRHASQVLFRRSNPNTPNGTLWHVSPERQYVVTLQGQAETGLGDGTKRMFDVGDVLLCDDLTGHGHTTRTGPEGRIQMAIFVPD